MIYVLLLENNKWYVGYTNRINGDRFLEHFDEKGSEWTKLHKPIQVMLFKEGSIDDEKTTTLEYMEKYGWYNVRGGPWCKVSMTEPPNELKPKNLPKPLNKTKSYIKNIKEDDKKPSIADNLIELIKIWKNIPDENSAKDTIINTDFVDHTNNNIIKKIKKNTSNGTKWTTDEINQLIKELKEKKSIKEITSLHSRSKNAIESKIKSILIKRKEKEDIVNISNDLCLTEEYINNLLTQQTFHYSGKDVYNKIYKRELQKKGKNVYDELYKHELQKKK